VRLLLDSNALIWWVTDPVRLSNKADQAIRNPDNQIVVSLVSLWEITIKIAKGGLPELGSSIQYLLDEVREQRFELLQLRPDHLLALGKLERLHRDPFDRLIVAQGIAERLPIATNDPSFSKYPVEIFW
jgi:PIN domain nuclease of toxin-antitoxin system